MDKKALNALCERARHLSLQLGDEKKRTRCLNMIDVLLEHAHWPDLKIGGWLEHIITVCIESGITTIDQERDFSRPIKHAYYKRCGVAVPRTVDVMARESNTRLAANVIEPMCHSCMVKSGHQRRDKGTHTSTVRVCPRCQLEKSILPLKHWRLNPNGRSDS